MVSVNSSALKIIPHLMQPGKTIFIAVRDAEKLNRDLLDGFVVAEVSILTQSPAIMLDIFLSDKGFS